jgi:hypothetical protein
MLEQDIKQAHPEAFDFVYGNLPAAKRVEFNRHLASCRYCQSVVDEYSEIGRIIKNLPPPAEPPADLEERTIAAMVAAMVEQRARTDRRPDTEDQAVTRPYPIPEVHHPGEPETQIQPRPQLGPPAEKETQLRQPPADQPPADQPPAEPAPTETAARPMVTRLPMWRRHRGRLVAAVAAAAAAITGAVAIPLSLLGNGAATAVIALHATPLAKESGFGAATGRATARQDASGSWDITLTVQHLKHFDPAPWYGCWYVSRDGRQVGSAGTFLVGPSGSGTFSMTSAVDPHDFSTMKITIGPPDKDGAFRPVKVVLSGHTLWRLHGRRLQPEASPQRLHASAHATEHSSK